MIRCRTSRLGPFLRALCRPRSSSRRSSHVPSQADLACPLLGLDASSWFLPCPSVRLAPLHERALVVFHPRPGTRGHQRPLHVLHPHPSSLLVPCIRRKLELADKVLVCYKLDVYLGPSPPEQAVNLLVYVASPPPSHSRRRPSSDHLRCHFLHRVYRCPLGGLRSFLDSATTFLLCTYGLSRLLASPYSILFNLPTLRFSRGLPDIYYPCPNY